MGLVKVAFWGFYCHRCGHRWVPRGIEPLSRARRDETPLKPLDPGEKPKAPVEEPRVCPRCKSPYWNRPRAG